MIFSRSKPRHTENISLEIVKWDADEFTWLQSSANEKGKISYTIHVPEADRYYIISDGNKSAECKSDRNGLLKFETEGSNFPVLVKIVLKAPGNISSHSL